MLASGTRSAVSLRRYTACLPPARCVAHREPFSRVEVHVRKGVVCRALGINPLKKGTVPFLSGLILPVSVSVPLRALASVPGCESLAPPHSSAQNVQVLVSKTRTNRRIPALLFPGLARQCVKISYSAYDEQLQCTTAGKVLTGFGWPLFVGGVTGAVITGIMFGVRKGKLRRLEHRMAYENSRAIRWDPASSRFVF